MRQTDLKRRCFLVAAGGAGVLAGLEPASGLLGVKAQVPSSSLPVGEPLPETERARLLEIIRLDSERINRLVQSSAIDGWNADRGMAAAHNLALLAVLIDDDLLEETISGLAGDDAFAAFAVTDGSP